MTAARILSFIGHLVASLTVVFFVPSAVFAQGPGTQDKAVVDYMSEPPGLIPEPPQVERAVIFADRHFGNGELTTGFYTNSFNMIPGAGWISLGPGYRYWGSKDRMFFDSSAAISSRGYKDAQARFELPKLASSRLLLGSQVRWQDSKRVEFFGEGPESLESNLSTYRLKSTNLVGYATLRPVKWLDIDTRIGRLDVSVPLQETTFIHSEAAVSTDTRDFPGHPTRGGVMRAAAARYSDRDGDLFSFTRYEAEAAQFVPLAGARVVLALRGWLAASETGEGQFVPFYLQPGLGGSKSLRSYTDYRFHDRNLMLVNAEARIAMMTHVDAAVFMDAGNVAARVGDLNFDKRSYGVGLRMHSRRQTYARLDMAHGDEGWRFLFRLTEPLSLGRHSKRTAEVPFVP